MSGLAHGSELDAFMPLPDVRERFETMVGAPPELVLDVAVEFDLQSLAAVRALIRTRAIILRAPKAEPRRARGLLAETLGLGWGLLVEEPGRFVVCGAACRPWEGDPGFEPIPPDRFAEWSQPCREKIAWSLEAQPLAPTRTRFAHEVRAVATDEEGRRRFRRYWRWARFGIIGIRLLLLPAIRREAERRWSTSGAGGRDVSLPGA
ncbi:MAG: hypothetical protein R2991_01850 [Thermoanaerobaculia bacterium]